MEVIVLDGEQRSALAVTRSLGRRGVKVSVGAVKNPSLSSCSRYCTRSFQYPSPYTDPIGFIQAIRDFTINSPNSILFPITDVTLTEILSKKTELQESAVIPFMDYAKYIQVSDKIALIRIARELNIPIPTSFLSTDFQSKETLIETIRKSGYPVVVKPSFSNIRSDDGWINAKVHYAPDENKLREILQVNVFQSFPFLVQKRVEGPGMGVFLLMKNGEVIARFAHRRIREKPPSGGVSVLCESIEPPVEAMRSAVKILEKLQWTGVAMVEFKIDREKNVPMLLEVNARFWGSLQLAISSGVDFPYLLYQLAIEDRIVQPEKYKIGLKSRWELGDLDHLFIRLLKKSSTLNLSKGYPGKIPFLKDFLLDFFRPSVKNEIFQSNDLKPFYHEVSKYILRVFNRNAR